jgi:hypothetical protein
MCPKVPRFLKTVVVSFHKDNWVTSLGLTPAFSSSVFG